MTISNEDVKAINAMKSAAFLNNLERWIDAVISRDGMADEELIRTIKETYERHMQINIEHHKFMMNNAKDNGDQAIERRHKLMAEVYASLIG